MARANAIPLIEIWHPCLRGREKVLQSMTGQIKLLLELLEDPINVGRKQGSLCVDSFGNDVVTTTIEMANHSHETLDVLQLFSPLFESGDRVQLTGIVTQKRFEGLFGSVDNFDKEKLRNVEGDLVAKLFKTKNMIKRPQGPRINRNDGTTDAIRDTFVGAHCGSESESENNGRGSSDHCDTESEERSNASDNGMPMLAGRMDQQSLSSRSGDMPGLYQPTGLSDDESTIDSDYS